MSTTTSKGFFIGDRSKRQFVHRVTEFFFKELRKGFASPYILLSSGVFFSYVTWRATVYYLVPDHEMRMARKLMLRVPMVENHNILWGFRNKGESSEGKRVPDMGRYAVEGDSAEREEELRRPHVIYSEPSELQERSSADNLAGEVDLVCLELPEYDKGLGDDVYYRSVHYVPNHNSSLKSRGVSEKSSQPQTTTNESKEENRTGSAMSNPSTSATVDVTSYLNRMPGGGEGVIHGIVKCKGVTELNNCVPYAGHLESEVARKLMLTLAPVHVLRDTAKIIMPIRFTFVKQVKVETLVIGLHSGELPRWLSSAFPNFNVDVMESDGALVRICRRFLGFRETSNLTLRIGNPLDYLQHLAAALTANSSRGKVRKSEAYKCYDLILINAVDGAGHLSTQFGRLETLHTLRNCMSDNGCIATVLPNRDAFFLYNMVQNWRMAFSGRAVVLIHCYTTPYTILMTFQDNAGRGKANMGNISSSSEFKDLLHAHLSHYGASRVQFDLTNELSEDNFKVLFPGQIYDVTAFLPQGHPELLARLATAAGSGRGLFNKCNTWLRRPLRLFFAPEKPVDLRV